MKKLLSATILFVSGAHLSGAAERGQYGATMHREIPIRSGIAFEPWLVEGSAFASLSKGINLLLDDIQGWKMTPEQRQNTQILLLEAKNLAEQHSDSVYKVLEKIQWSPGITGTPAETFVRRVKHRVHPLS